ncbi:MAG: hypothetical protein RBT61_13210 [Candidatus Kapabacteria bacterium]|nr:hypothetical protein [Candidatus Kapabacteria bacterium]
MNKNCIWVILCITILIIMMPSKLTAQDTYDPTYCNEGDTTTWNGPVTAIGVRLPLSFVACTDTNCIVNVKFVIKGDLQ